MGAVEIDWLFFLGVMLASGPAAAQPDGSGELEPTQQELLDFIHPTAPLPF